VVVEKEKDTTGQKRTAADTIWKMRIWWMLCGRRGAEEVVEVWSLEMECTVSR
jgi:hypothetical protein